MGLFDFFKNKGQGTQKGLTLEVMIVKTLQEIILSSGVFRRETVSGFLSLGQRERSS